MKALSLQYRNSVRGRWGVVLFLSLLALPYLVDVAYYGDFTPTHFAQETFIEEDAQALDDKSSFCSTDTQDDVVVSAIFPPLERQTCAQDHLSAGDLFLPPYLISASLVSRPPPAS